MLDPASWWNSLAQDTREKIQLAIATAVVTAVTTTLIPKLLWPAAVRLTKELLEFAYKRFSGYGLFHRWARRRYLECVRQVLQRIVNPWSSERHTMGNLFVPIKVDTRFQIPHFVSGAKKAERLVSLRDAVARYRAFVLVGEPGAGKTTALKAVGLAALECRLPLGTRQGQSEMLDPVWVELRRFPAQTRSLQAHIIQTYSDFGFPNATSFVQHRLSTRSLLILLDGLDEVADQDLPAVLDKIREFAHEFPDNRIIVTCRVAHYDRQLDDLSEATVAVTPFNDVQIGAYLRHRSFPPGKSAVQLMTLLRERPEVRAICRNPLLLTIVASLYAETDYDLPSSRCEFYSTCIDALLRRWDFRREIDRKNRFQVTTKSRVLEQVALNLQKRPEPAADAGEPEIVRLVAEALPDLGLPSSLAEDVVREIIRNTGLLIYVAPERLRFAHLTFQEFFAARQVDASSTEEMMFDPDQWPSLPAILPHWREVAILFCGISKRAGQFISKLTVDPELAAACIAEGGAAPVALATNVLRLLEQRPDVPAALRAMAAMAADERRPWSSEALSLIRIRLADPNVRTVSSAIWALACVPTAGAAASLVDALRRPDMTQLAKDALKQVGAPALPALQSMLGSKIDENGKLVCLELCSYVLTPEVIDVLLPVIFSTVSTQRERERACYSLGVLLRDPAIEEALRLTKTTDVESRIEMREDLKTGMGRKSWPFFEEKDTILPLAVDAIVATLACEDLTRDPESELLDPRVAIPLSISLKERQLGPAEIAALFTREPLERFESLPTRTQSITGPYTLKSLVFNHICAVPAEQLWDEWGRVESRDPNTSNNLAFLLNVLEPNTPIMTHTVASLVSALRGSASSTEVLRS